MCRRTPSVELDTSATPSKNSLTNNRESTRDYLRFPNVDGSLALDSNNTSTAQSLSEAVDPSAPSVAVNGRQVTQTGSKVIDSGKKVEILVPLVVTDGHLFWQCKVSVKPGDRWVVYEEFNANACGPLRDLISSSQKLTFEERTQVAELLGRFVEHNQSKLDGALRDAGCEPDNLHDLPLACPSSPQ
jgi:hypothetical protein